MTFKQKAKSALFKVSKGRWGTVEVPQTHTETNDETKMFAVKYITFARQAKMHLASIGEPVILDPVVASALDKVVLSQEGKDKKNGSVLNSMINEELQDAQIR